jgi:hypothetical protein
LITRTYVFEVTVSEDGRGGAFNKPVAAQNMGDAWIAVAKALKDANLSAWVTKIVYQGSEL